MNSLLKTLSEADWRRVESKLTRLRMARGDVLVDVGHVVSTVYFIDEGVVSIVCPFDDGDVTEVTTIGCEGFVGVGSLLDDDTATARHVVTVPGVALGCSSEAFRDVLESTSVLDRNLKRYTQYLIGQISQSVACNQVHDTHERLARWLLVAHDRVRGDDLALTHDSLAEALGVRRATITVAAKEFRNAGLIDGERGLIRVLDRDGLEDVSCSCYASVRRQYERLLPGLYPEPSG